MKSLPLALPILLSWLIPAHAQSNCAMADILFGPISLEKLYHPLGDYETALVRSDAPDDPDKPFNAILGEISVDRGGFAVRTPSQVVVGTISADLVVEGWDDGCSAFKDMLIEPEEGGGYTLYSGDDAIGSIKGFFPMNDFGVPSE